uniref:Uncharacterized protein n=1 Tax=Anguilla anguilla TaxID=7936 RepID=A0A0E9PCC8_ANGAN
MRNHLYSTINKQIKTCLMTPRMKIYFTGKTGKYMRLAFIIILFYFLLSSAKHILFCVYFFPVFFTVL